MMIWTEKGDAGDAALLPERPLGCFTQKSCVPNGT
jgi:hypothetical protein